MHKQSWSPYVIGASIGVLNTFAMATAKRPLGITTSFENTAALVGEALASQALSVESYKQERVTAPKIDWEAALVVGVFIGSLTSARMARDLCREAVPNIWSKRVGKSPAIRLAVATCGGAMMMYGARIARGCTSGHGISGSMQFAASSWLFNPIFFASGAIVTKAFLGGAK